MLPTPAVVDTHLHVFGEYEPALEMTPRPCTYGLDHVHRQPRLVHRCARPGCTFTISVPVGSTDDG